MTPTDYTSLYATPQTKSFSVSDGIMSIRDTALDILEAEAPSKRQRRSLVSVADSLLELQNSVVKQIPDLVPDDCTKYSIARLHSANNYTTNRPSVIPSRNLRTRTFDVDGADIPLPENMKQYSAAEVCSILQNVDNIRDKYLEKDDDMHTTKYA